jgi:hypothetical protein
MPITPLLILHDNASAAFAAAAADALISLRRYFLAFFFDFIFFAC